MPSLVYKNEEKNKTMFILLAHVTHPRNTSERRRKRIRTLETCRERKSGWNRAEAERIVLLSTIKRISKIYSE